MIGPTRATKRKTFSPPKYEVLLWHQLSERDVQFISGAVTLLGTGLEAQALARQDNFWSYEHMDSLGRAGVLKYKGVETAVFWKRQSTKIVVQPHDPVPTGILREPDDIWMRYELFGISARQVNMRHKVRVQVKDEDYKLLRTEVKIKDERISDLEEEVSVLTEKVSKENVDGLLTRITTLRTEVTQLGEAVETNRRQAHSKFDVLMKRYCKFLAGGLDILYSMKANSHISKLHSMLFSMMTKLYSLEGVVIILPGKGMAFDPKRHHAVTSYGQSQNPVILDVLGYGLSVDGVVVKAADVTVGGE